MMISAFLPSASTSQSIRPMALAPFVVAIFRTSSGATAEASLSRSFASPVVKNISRNMSRQLLLEAPSVPIPTLIPFSRKRVMGAMPLASLVLEPGLVITCRPFFANRSISSSVKYTQ